MVLNSLINNSNVLLRGPNSKKKWKKQSFLTPDTKSGHCSAQNWSLSGSCTPHLDFTVHSETEIIDYLTRGQVKEEVFAVYSVVKQTPQGSRTRFKTLVAVGDRNGHVGLGIKCYKGKIRKVFETFQIHDVLLLGVMHEWICDASFQRWHLR